MSELIKFPTSGVTKLGIVAFEAMLKEMCASDPSVAFEGDENTSHFFAPGMYARALFIPAGSIVVGKAHKTEHINMLVQGVLSVATDDGVKTVHAPFLVNAVPGNKRIVYAHEDSIWINFHPTELTDVAEIERQVIMTENEYLALAQAEEALALEQIKKIGE